MRIRHLVSGEEGFLRRMQYHALFTPPGQDPFPESTVDEPQIARYYRDWGRFGDLALVADEEWELVGAIWCRLFVDDDRGYGYIDEHTPEMSMAVLPAYRGKGTGTALLQELLSKLKDMGCRSLSLSVDASNPVIELYLRTGFEQVSSEGNPTLQIKF